MSAAKSGLAAIARAKGPFTLAIDIGGSHVKASVLDAKGRVIAPVKRVRTPRPATPKAMLKAIAELAQEFPPFDRVSAGFPGYVRHGRVHTAPNLGTKAWAGFRLDRALAAVLKKPARILNDADVQGLAAIRGRGIEFVLTLGTGMGSALFEDGRLLPHLELGQHPIAGKKRTYDRYIGNAALQRIGKRAWNKRLLRVIDVVRTLVNFDRLYLGGGNTRLIKGALPPLVSVVGNIDGIKGGVHLWDAQFAAHKATKRP